MCFDGHYLSVHSCGHAKRRPHRLGWLNCVNYPCALRLLAEDPARYNYNSRAWSEVKRWPPFGTPAQTIRFDEDGPCGMCAYWEKVCRREGLKGDSARLPMNLVVGNGYPVDLEYRPPMNGGPWTYVKPEKPYWVYVLDGWQGMVDREKTDHIFAYRGRNWGLNFCQDIGGGCSDSEVSGREFTVRGRFQWTPYKTRMSKTVATDSETESTGSETRHHVEVEGQ